MEKKIHPKRGFIVIIREIAEIKKQQRFHETKKHRKFRLQVHIGQFLIVDFPFRIYFTKSALAGTQLSIRIECRFVNINWDL